MNNKKSTIRDVIITIFICAIVFTAYSILFITGYFSSIYIIGVNMTTGCFHGLFTGEYKCDAPCKGTDLFSCLMCPATGLILCVFIGLGLLITYCIYELLFCLISSSYALYFNISAEIKTIYADLVEIRIQKDN